MSFVPKTLPTRVPSPTRGTTTRQAEYSTAVRTQALNVAQVLSGGIAGCTAELLTIPLDTLKVRAQTATKDALRHPGATKQLKVTQIVQHTYDKGGLRAFFGGRVGLTAACQRQMIMASVKFGCYEIVKGEYCRLLGVTDDPKFTPNSVKILAASTTGALAVFIGQPTDVVKVRMQAKLDTYRSTSQAYKDIYTTEGIKRGLWRGTCPGALRNMCVNVAEIGFYDIIKGFMLRNEIMRDEWPCFVVCSICTGALATLVSSPADVLKTVYSSAKPGKYRNLGDCLVQIWRDNGIRAFYRGVAFNGSRLIAWNMVMFLTLENLRKSIQHAR